MDISKKNRIYWLDVARSVAIITVVIVHAIDPIYHMNNFEEWASISSASRFFRTFFFSIGRIGVPIFLFLSGYILLSRNYDEENSIITFYKRKLIKLLITVEFWLIFYDIFGMLYLKNGVTLKVLFQNILFLKPNYFWHIWYMPMILGLYIIIPFLGMLLQKYNTKIIMIPLGIAIWAFFICSNFSHFLGLFGAGSVAFTIDTSFLGGIYGVYLVIGYLEKRDWLKWIPNVWIVVIGVISFAGVVGYQYFSYYMGKGYNVWYDNIFLLICSTCVFDGMKRLLSQKDRITRISLVTSISDYSLGIFFIHAPLHIILYQQFEWELIPRPLAVGIMFISLFLVSYLLVWILKNIKWVRKYILGM